MRRRFQICALVLTGVLLLAGCGQAEAEPAIPRATDYIVFTDYPEEGEHTNSIGRREFVADGFSFVLDTHADLDFSVGRDQLGVMTAALGEPLTDAYRWRLNNHEFHDDVELTKGGMETVAKQPAYHAEFRYMDTEAADAAPMAAEFYCLAYDGSLCTFTFVYEEDGDGKELAKRIVKGAAISNLYGDLMDYDLRWPDDYRRPTFDYKEHVPTDAGGSLLRVSGKLLDGDPSAGGTACLRMYDSSGYYWELEIPQAALDTLTERMTGALEREDLYGVPVEVFGRLTSTAALMPNPLESGPRFTMSPDYLITLGDSAVYEFD